MTALIIEDERIASESLAEQLMSVDEQIIVVGICRSVRESIKWLDTNPHPDIILMDIQLSDGLCFQIFKYMEINTPVVFITGYDKYLTQSFEYSSIDYLLKPIEHQKLISTIRKYKLLKNHFTNNHSAFVELLLDSQKRKSFLIVKKGAAFQAVRFEDIVYFSIDKKLILLTDKLNMTYVTDKGNLSELERELDPVMFHRANRKYIININFVRSFSAFDKKLTVKLTLPLQEELSVSQDNIVSFKKWMGKN